MKILITVDPEIPVPPTNYGGIERIVDSLIYEYKKNGHEVFLLAHPQSSNSGVNELFSWPRLASRGFINTFYNSRHLAFVVKKTRPDVIHSFSRLLYLYLLKIRQTPHIVQTYQRNISIKSTNLATKVFGDKIMFTCCGEHMIKNHPIAKKCIPVHNFTNTDYFKPSINKPKDYLFFLGRIEEIKGTKEAIEASIKANERLIIAGNIQSGHDDYFEKEIKPYLKNRLIEYVGPVNDQQKLDYFQGAKAFLFPIKWEEPFGIVMAEAMACGVPVIGFRKGSVPEVVKHGITGFVVDDVDAMVQAIKKINLIDTSEVRRDCVERFSLKKIGLKYLQIFNRLTIK